MSHLDSVESFGKRTDLVNLDKDRVCSTLLDTLLEVLNIGNEEVITYELALVADSFGKFNPSFPVVLIETILDRVDRIFVYKLLEVSDLLVNRKFLSVRIFLHTCLELFVIIEELVAFLNAELRCCAVHSDGNVLSRNIASFLDSLHDAVESVVDTIELRSETTLVTYCCRKATAFEHFLESVEYFSTHSYTFSDAWSTYRANHELLERDRSVRVSTTVDDVHHRNRKNI